MLPSSSPSDDVTWLMSLFSTFSLLWFKLRSAGDNRYGLCAKLGSPDARSRLCTLTLSGGGISLICISKLAASLLATDAFLRLSIDALSLARAAG